MDGVIHSLEFINWVKCVLCLQTTKTVLHSYVDKTWKIHIDTWTTAEKAHIHVVDFIEDVNKNRIKFVKEKQAKLWKCECICIQCNNIFIRLLEIQQNPNSKQIVWYSGQGNDNKPSLDLSEVEGPKGKTKEETEDENQTCDILIRLGSIAVYYKDNDKSFKRCSRDVQSKLRIGTCNNNASATWDNIKIHWSLANMFMCQKRTDIHNTCPEDTDASLFFKMMKNCKLFHTDENQKYDKIIGMRDFLMHSAKNQVSEVEMTSIFAELKNFLKLFRLHIDYEDIESKINKLFEMDLRLAEVEYVENKTTLSMRKDALETKQKALRVDILQKQVRGESVEELKQIEDNNDKQISMIRSKIDEQPNTIQTHVIYAKEQHVLEEMHSNTLIKEIAEQDENLQIERSVQEKAVHIDMTLGNKHPPFPYDSSQNKVSGKNEENINQSQANNRSQITYETCEPVCDIYDKNSRGDNDGKNASLQECAAEKDVSREDLRHIHESNRQFTIKHTDERYDISSKQDTKKCCSVTDMCLLEDGSIVLTDEYNESIKHLDNKKRLISVRLNGQPYGICSLGSNKIAVTLPRRKQVYIYTTAEKLSPSGSFKTKSECLGITCFDEKIYVCCLNKESGKIQVYNKRYEIVDLYLQEIHPGHICISKSSCHLYTSEYVGKNMITMTIGGIGVSETPLSGVIQGMCSIDENIICVITLNSDQFVVVDTNGSILQSIDSEIKAPKAVLFDQRERKLVIASDMSSVLFVCKLL